MIQTWFYGCLSASFPLMVLAPRAVVILFVVTFLGVLMMSEKRGEIFREMMQSKLLWSLGALGVWGMISLLWSLEPKRGLSLVLGLLGIWGMGGFMAYSLARCSVKENVSKISNMLAIGILISALLMIIEAKTEGGILTLVKGRIDGMFVYNTATSMIVIILCPLVLYFLRQDKKSYWWMVVGGILGIFMLESSTSKVILLLIPFMLFLFHRFSCLIKVAGGLALASQVLIPWLMQYILTYENARHYLSFPLKGSLYHRLKIWHFAASQIFEKPFFGWGLDSSRADVFAKVMDKFELWDEGTQSYFTHEEFMLSLHPHNAALQIWLELGFVGIVLWVLTLGLILQMIVKITDGWWRAVLATSFFSAFLIANNAYGIWQSWWMVVLTFCFVGSYGLYRQTVIR